MPGRSQTYLGRQLGSLLHRRPLAGLVVKAGRRVRVLIGALYQQVAEA